MAKEIETIIELDDKLNNEQNIIYHNVSVAMGLSDSASRLLYVLYIAETPCTQKEICSEWFFSKQTINTTIRNLVQKEYIILESVEGSKKEKYICLTKSGRELAEQTVSKLRNAEVKAYSKLMKEEQERYIRIHTKLNTYLKETTDALIEECKNDTGNTRTKSERNL